MHGCPDCLTHPNHNDEEREEFLTTQGVLIKTRGCAWRRRMSCGNLPMSPISPFLYTDKITEVQLINAVRSGNAYGFVLVDLEPTEAAQKFVKMTAHFYAERNQARRTPRMDEDRCQQKDFSTNNIGSINAWLRNSPSYRSSFC